MSYPINFNPIIAIDLRDELLMMSRVRQGFYVFDKINLKELVSRILTLKIEATDFSGSIWELIYDDLKLDDHPGCDFLDLEIFIEKVTNIIDLKIANDFPKEYDRDDFVFHSWLDSTTVCLHREHS